jgi:hypothetical protein
MGADSREEAPLMMLPLLDELAQGVDARLRWLG